MAEESSIPDPILTGSASAYVPGTLRGWSQLQQALNVTLPNLLVQAEARREATERLLGGG